VWDWCRDVSGITARKCINLMVNVRTREDTTQPLLLRNSLHSAQKRLEMARVVAKISHFYLHTYAFIHKRNEPHLPLSSQTKLVFICRLWRDGRLSYITRWLTGPQMVTRGNLI